LRESTLTTYVREVVNVKHCLLGRVIPTALVVNEEHARCMI